MEEADILDATFLGEAEIAEAEAEGVGEELEEGDFGDFMNEINEHFTKLVHESYQAPKDAWEEWSGKIM